MMVTDRAVVPGQGTVSVQRATHNATDRSVQTVDPVSRAHVREAGTQSPLAGATANAPRQTETTCVF
jgi:hypothetical protein